MVATGRHFSLRRGRNSRRLMPRPAILLAATGIAFSALSAPRLAQELGLQKSCTTAMQGLPSGVPWPLLLQGSASWAVRSSHVSGPEQWTGRSSTTQVTSEHFRAHPLAPQAPEATPRDEGRLAFETALKNASTKEIMKHVWMTKSGFLVASHFESTDSSTVSMEYSRSR